MVYERSEYYSTSTAASENGHGPGTLYCSKMVYTGNGLTRTRALIILGRPQLFRRTLQTTTSLSSKLRMMRLSSTDGAGPRLTGAAHLPDTRTGKPYCKWVQGAPPHRVWP